MKRTKQTESVDAVDAMETAANKAAAEASHMDDTKDAVIASLHKVDKKVNALTSARRKDPDTLTDKLVKSAIPSLTGMVAGHVFQSIWNAVTNKLHPGTEDDEQDQRRGLLASLVFAALSAAFVAVITQLSDRGTIATIHKIQKRRARK
ncbi:membrane associated protein [Bifidobacterium dolichotidis]|uniref:Membrane associated protein n=2 Tax=Bifidobacterium dolichotidis TaxID=2306976 RepID=A0A430FKH0_9BIFI|nr:membrane associated protein [Bifidobacterium dolichotidis]